jgi:ribonuclease P protein component
VYLLSAENNQKPDLGIAVAKKLVKRAVDRNYLKRIVRELVWTAQSTNLKSDVVVKLNKPIGRQTRGRVRKKEKDLLRKQIMGLI